MRKLRLLLILALGCLTTEAAAQITSRAWMILGAQYSGMQGTGEGDNAFDMGYGGVFELGFYEANGWGMVAYGTGLYQTKNRVGDDAVKARIFYPYYMDIRRYFLNRYVSPFFSFGGGFGRMHFEGTKGSDNQYFLSTGLGAHIPGNSDVFIQVMVRPFYIFNNSVGQKWGIETNVGIGLSWHRK